VRASLRALAAVCWLAAGAAAQGDDADAARTAFVEGTSAFNLGQWDAAVEAWERGYKLKSDAVFLYNIAQAHRQANHLDKALFFYRSYLRTAADASNRDEVELRIAQLEKALTVEARAREAPPAVSLPSPSPTPQRPPSSDERADLGLGVGLRVWAAGVSASPSLVLQLRGGWVFFSRGRIALRVGGELDYSFLKDVGSVDHFIHLSAELGVRVRLWRERIFFAADLGLGAQILAGLSSGSAFLSPSSSRHTAALFLLHPALALEVRPVRRLSLWVSPALGYSPLPAGFVAPALVDVDLFVGASVRLD
jgi:tetratricopeptide (TPR) repeat protein